jgi:hypothetical protein
MFDVRVQEHLHFSWWGVIIEQYRLVSYSVPVGICKVSVLTGCIDAV